MGCLARRDYRPGLAASPDFHAALPDLFAAGDDLARRSRNDCTEENVRRGRPGDCAVRDVDTSDREGLPQTARRLARRQQRDPRPQRKQETQSFSFPSTPASCSTTIATAAGRIPPAVHVFAPPYYGAGEDEHNLLQALNSDPRQFRHVWVVLYGSGARASNLEQRDPALAAKLQATFGTPETRQFTDINVLEFGK